MLDNSAPLRLAAFEVGCGVGARDAGCGAGPGEFRKRSDAALRAEGLALTWRQMPQSLCAAHVSPLLAVSQAARWSAVRTRRLAANGDKFVVIGGDHSCAIGTWSGVADGLRKTAPLGLVWVDAHMDMHTPVTTPSGAIHGMPLAVLLGYGARELTSIAGTDPAVAPRHICLVGARSFEPEEVEFAERLGIRVIGMDEVRRRGIDAALAEAKAIASHGTAGYGVSLDLDAFDPVDAPGVGSPAPGGIRAAAFLAPWRELGRDRRCLGIELVEYNPSRDFAGQTARLLEQLVAATYSDQDSAISSDRRRGSVSLPRWR